METHIVVPLKQCLANMPVEGHWLQCATCLGFYHIDSVAADHTRAARCPFSDCSGHGIDLDLIFPPATTDGTTSRVGGRCY